MIYFDLLQCPSQKCGNKKRKKSHALTDSEPEMCIHLYCVYKCFGFADVRGTSSAAFECDRVATVRQLVDKILQLPSLTEPEQAEFMLKSKNFETKISNTNLSESLNEYLPTKCDNCGNSNLKDWKHKTKSSFLFSCGELKLVEIPVRMCTDCKVLSYPDVTQYGFIPLHNKVLISYSYILEIGDSLFIGGSLTSYITKKMINLAKCEGLSDIETNVNNISSLIERSAVAITALLIRENDLNRVMCWLCGRAPKSANTDGNTKDSIRITNHMKFERGFKG